MALKGLQKIPLKKIKIDEKTEDAFEENQRRNFPVTFDVTDEQVPESADWQPGEDYLMVIKIRQKSKTGDKVKGFNSSFKITAYKDITPPTDPKDMSDEEIAEFQGRNMGS